MYSNHYALKGLIMSFFQTEVYNLHVCIIVYYGVDIEFFKHSCSGIANLPLIIPSVRQKAELFLPTP